MRSVVYIVASFILASTAACMSSPGEGDEIDVSDRATMTGEERGALDKLCIFTGDESLVCSRADGEFDPSTPTTNECHEANGCAWCVEGSASCWLCDGWDEPKCYEVIET